MRIGYACVSTQDPTLALQLSALKKAGCQRVFTDQRRGAQAQGLGLQAALAQLRPADTLVVCKLDRLGRSLKGWVALLNRLQSQQVHFKSLSESLDTKTPAGRFLWQVLASLAHMEPELMVEPTAARLEASRRQGGVRGPKRQMSEAKVQTARTLLASGMAPREVADRLGVSVPTLYRWVPASSRTQRPSGAA